LEIGGEDISREDFNEIVKPVSFVFEDNLYLYGADARRISVLNLGK